MFQFYEWVEGDLTKNVILNFDIITFPLVLENITYKRTE